MENEEFLVAAMRRAIAELPPGQREACHTLTDMVRRLVVRAGDPVGRLALGLVGAELLARLGVSGTTGAGQRPAEIPEHREVRHGGN